MLLGNVNSVWYRPLHPVGFIEFTILPTFEDELEIKNQASFLSLRHPEQKHLLTCERLV